MGPTRDLSAAKLSEPATDIRPRVAAGTGSEWVIACRVGCGACCIALSISSPIPGMPGGKPSGARCLQLTPDNRCRIFGQPGRPEVCNRLRPNSEMCGDSMDEALAYLYELERATRP